MIRAIGTGAGAAMAALALLAPAGARAQEWTVACAEGVCEATVTAVREDGGRVLVATFLRAEGGTPEMQVALPLGMAIEPGVRVVADGETALTASFRVCTAETGCRAAAAVTPEAAAAMAGAGELSVQAFPFGAEAPVSVPMPTGGLADALAALTE